MYILVNYTPKILKKSLKYKIRKLCMHVPMRGLSTPRFEDETCI